MKSKGVVVLGSVATTIALIAACSGSDPTGSIEGPPDAAAESATNDTGSTTQDSSVAPPGDCQTNEDCEKKIPKTTPDGCAIATCDTIQKKCVFKSKDLDGDGHNAKNCSAATATVETGDDCDDEDPNTHPGAWDGPASDEDSGPNAKSDRCDQKDNDCNGSPDDGKIAVDGGDRTCKCDPGKPLPCYEYPNGIPIDANTLDGDNNPKGACKKGTRSCPNGIPGNCIGAVGPTTEQCNDLDLDCNGTSGNAGDTVPGAPVWYKDGDNDNYGDMNTPPQNKCVAPEPSGWKALIPNTDCNDADPQVNPGLAEVCDGKDNNCAGGIDEGVQLNFCADADGDTYCTATCQMACTAPTGYRLAATCSAGIDCNDTAGAGASVYPTAFEKCGDGINSNCDPGNGDSETYPLLGQACTAGTSGICKRTGSNVCNATQNDTECDATAGTATSGSSTISADPLIDMSQVRSGYDPRWDYNCNNTVEVINTIYGGNFRSSACGGNYQSACSTLVGETACNAGVLGVKEFSCEYDPPGSFFWIDPASMKMCGRKTNYISCLWQWNGGAGCDYVAGTFTASALDVSCR